MLRLLSLFLMVSVYKGDLISFEGDAAVIQGNAKIQFGETQLTFSQIEEIISTTQKMIQVCGTDLSVCLTTEQNQLLMRDLNNLKDFEPIIPQDIKKITEQNKGIDFTKLAPVKTPQQQQEEELDQRVKDLIYNQ